MGVLKVFMIFSSQKTVQWKIFLDKMLEIQKSKLSLTSFLVSFNILKFHFSSFRIKKSDAKPHHFCACRDDSIILHRIFHSEPVLANAHL